MDRRSRLRILTNRLLIALTVAALLAGLFYNQWRIVLNYARLL